ncbi:MAG TPA: hypothetical protein VMD27_07470 [Candidatus Aquilonibacter sp.]|nr:hypothetical protein [Candidatus Aquilonibacter sp.]
MKWRRLSSEDYPCNHPAPILTNVTINGLDGVRCSPGWPAIIDSGSDRTIIPSVALPYLEFNFAADSLDHTTFTITGSAPIKSTLVFVQLSHEDFGKLEPTEVAHMDRQTILFGRDCLKQLLFTFHGPQKHFIIHQNRSSFSLWWLRLLPKKFRHNVRPPEK